MRGCNLLPDAPRTRLPMQAAQTEPMVARACPSCGGALRAELTLCERCRAGLEAHILGDTLAAQELCFSTPAAESSDSDDAQRTAAALPAAPQAPAALPDAADSSSSTPSSFQVRHFWH